MNTLRSRFEIAPDGRTRVELSGAIDENSDINGVFSQMAGPVVLNMRGVERVNSMGVHRWVPHVTRYSAQYPLAIEDISYSLVQNANAVANMFGTAKITSCMAPYFCASCNDNVTISVTADDVAVAGQAPPVKQCGRCRAVMEFDELDGYFAFFKDRAGS